MSWAGLSDLAPRTISYYIVTDAGNVKISETEALNMIMFRTADVWHENDASCILRLR